MKSYSIVFKSLGSETCVQVPSLLLLKHFSAPFLFM